MIKISCYILFLARLKTCPYIKANVKGSVYSTWLTEYRSKYTGFLREVDLEAKSYSESSVNYTLDTRMVPISRNLNTADLNI